MQSLAIPGGYRVLYSDGPADAYPLIFLEPSYTFKVDFDGKAKVVSAIRSGRFDVRFLVCFEHQERD